MLAPNKLKMENCNQLLPPVTKENQPKEEDDIHFANCQNLGAAGAISTTMQKGFISAPQKPIKTRKMKKTEATQIHGGGARIIRSAGRKDRHSKVSTARGTRDRRVRLSPKTAIEFYDVQDRLGYDRPSKAIDWLMNEAKAAITALDEPTPPPPTAYAGETRPENTVPGHSAQAQSILAWNYGNTPPPSHFPGPNTNSVIGPGQIIREPLQSSYSEINTHYYNPLQIFTIPEENEMDNFLHYSD